MRTFLLHFLAREGTVLTLFQSIRPSVCFLLKTTNQTSTHVDQSLITLLANTVHYFFLTAAAPALLLSRGAANTAHSDLEVPDFSFYRRASNKDSTARNADSQGARAGFAYLMTAGVALPGAYGASSIVNMFISNLAASKDVLAMAKIEVPLSDIPEGKNMTFKWRGKPLFVRHRCVESEREA